MQRLQQQVADAIRAGPGRDRRRLGGRRQPAQSDAERRAARRSRCKPRDERTAVRRRRSSSGCKRAVADIPGMTVYFQPVQDIQISTRISRAQYQYTLVGNRRRRGRRLWSDRLADALRAIADAARRRVGGAGRRPARHDQRRPREGRPARHLDAGRSTTRSTTRSASGRSRPSTPRRTSTAWSSRPRRNTRAIRRRCRSSTCRRHSDQPLQSRRANIHRSSFVPASSTQVPLAAFAELTAPPRRSSIAHQEQFPSVTISFNLAPGAALSDAVGDHRVGRARDRHADLGDRQLFGRRRRVRQVARRRALADPRRRRSRSTSCSACSTRASSTRSRSSRRCPRPASARCWR